MDERNLRALCFLTPDYFFYATNYFLDVAPWERPVAAVIPRSGTPFLVMHELSTHHLRMAKERGSIWVDDVTIYSEHPRVRARLALTPQWPALMAQVLRERGLAKARIGVDGGSPFLARVSSFAPDVTFVPCEQEMRELRWVKQPAELALMRQAASLSDWGQEQFRELARPGAYVQECDFQVSAALAREAAHRHPGEQVEIRSMTLAGAASAAPHGTGAITGARFENGDGIVNILIIRVNGLVIENERTWILGSPSDIQKKAYEAALLAQKRAIAQMTTGNTLANVDAAALAVFEEAGFAENVMHRTGHGVGIAGHEFPADMPFAMRPLREHEVYSAEPGIYLYGVGGFRFDDTVVVGAEPEVLTKAPKDLAAQTIG